MLTSGKEALLDAYRDGRALGAFSVYNIELGSAVLTAAESVAVPVIVQAGSSAFGYAGESALGELALAMAREAPGPVGVHLDHSHSLDEIVRCLDRGYTSVMIDGSHLRFDRNVQVTARAVSIAEPYGAWVEAELGVVSGDEDRTTFASAAPGTDPRQAAQFVEETGVDALAVAIGNVHGMTSAPVTLDLERLGEIRERTAIPLVLHGASGLDEGDIAAAIELGVAKVNVNAEVRGAYIRALADCADPGDDLAAFSAKGIAAAADVVAAKLRLFTRHDNGSELP